jgi:hypothetical protein
MSMTTHPPGCTCERTILQFQAYLLKTLPPRESLATAEHLEACLTCAQQLGLYQITIGGFVRG